MYMDLSSVWLFIIFTHPVSTEWSSSVAVGSISACLSMQNFLSVFPPDKSERIKAKVTKFGTHDEL